jgi:hypothetical protein
MNELFTRRGVLQAMSLAGLSVTGGAFDALAQTSPGVPGKFDPRRWWTRDYRIVQTNLREIDILENPKEIARAVREFGGTAIVSNIGGIISFYPTKLKYHHRNPYMKGDFVKAMIEAAHAENLAYLGRFDTSKGMGLVYKDHPEWFMVNRDGTPREYEGTYQACPSGLWLQDYALQILREALKQYKPDGVFFNGVGFGQNDYAGIDRGSCVCENCRREFRAMFGLELPTKEGFADPNWRKYLEYQERVTAGINAKMDKLAAELIPGVPIFRHEEYEHVGRGELQRRVARPAPEWQYQSGEQLRGAKARNPGKPFSATSTTHVDYPWRQVTETSDYHINRFAQTLAYGGKLDLYLMGSLADQDDPSYLPPVSELFKWEAANTRFYADLNPAARVGLYESRATQRFGAATPFAQYRNGEVRGAISALVDSRIAFQSVSSGRVADGTVSLNETFDVIVAPHVLCLPEREAAALDQFVAQGGLLISTGMTAGFDGEGKALERVPLASFPFEKYGAPEKVAGWTLDAAKSAFKFAKGRVPIDVYYFAGTSKAGVENLVPFAPDQRFGPPEFSYAVPGAIVRTSPGVAHLAHGKGHAVHIPWLLDWHYYRDGLPIHQQLLAGLIARYAPAQRVTLTGTGPVELAVQRRGEKALLVHVINYAGQRNGRYDTPPDIHGLSLGIESAPSQSASALVAGQMIKGVSRAGDPSRLWFDLPPVGAFEAIAIGD